MDASVYPSNVQLSPPIFRRRKNTSRAVSLGYTYKLLPWDLYHVRTRTCRLRQTKVPRFQSRWKPCGSPRLKAEGQGRVEIPRVVAVTLGWDPSRLAFHLHHRNAHRYLSRIEAKAVLYLSLFPEPHGHRVGTRAVPCSDRWTGNPRPPTSDSVRHVDFWMQSRAIETAGRNDKL